MKHIIALNKAGDTIVEVMVVLTILSLAFGIAYATANSGLIRSRAAEEHTEALGMLEGQVELVRAEFSDNQDLTSYNEIANVNYSFCIETPVSTDPPNLVPFDNYVVPQNGASDSLSSPPYPDNCKIGTGYYYYLSITYRKPPSGENWQPYFDFIVRWQGPGGLGLQQEELTYKINYLVSAPRQLNIENPVVALARVDLVSSNVISQQFNYRANLKVAG